MKIAPDIFRDSAGGRWGGRGWGGLSPCPRRHPQAPFPFAGLPYLSGPDPSRRPEIAERGAARARGWGLARRGGEDGQEARREARPCCVAGIQIAVAAMRMSDKVNDFVHPLMVGRVMRAYAKKSLRVENKHPELFRPTVAAVTRIPS